MAQVFSGASRQSNTDFEKSSAPERSSCHSHTRGACHNLQSALRNPESHHDVRDGQNVRGDRDVPGDRDVRAVAWLLEQSCVPARARRSNMHMTEI